MRRRSLVALSACLCGCSLITSLDALRSDAGATDGGGDAAILPEASDDASGDAGGGNLVTNPSFDEGQGGCGPSWGNGYGMTYTRVSPGRTGSFACMVCIQGSTGSYELDDSTAIAVQAGSYYVEAWLASAADAAPIPAGVQVYFTGDGGLSGCNGSATYCQGNFFTAPVGSWSSSSTTFDVTGSGQITIDLHAYAGDDASCFIVDDVAAYLQ